MSLQALPTADEAYRTCWRRRLAAAVLALIGFGLTGYVTWTESERALQRQRNEVGTQASSVRSRLESTINASVHLSLGLVTSIEVNPNADREYLDRLSSALLRHSQHVRNIAIAPDNVVRYVYPLQGNEKALGLRYLDHPVQRDDVLRMMRKGGMVLTGPLTLVQGGVALINRFPIFLQKNGRPDRFWGTVSVVLDYGDLLRSGGLDPEIAGVRYALRKHDTLRTVIYGDSDLFAQAPLLQDIVLPDGSRWQLAALPASGWNHGLSASTVPWLLPAGVLLSMLLSILFHAWLRQIQEIRQREAELKLSASVFEGSNEGILITDSHGSVVSINPAFERITGYRPADLIGRTLEGLPEGDYLRTHAETVQQSLLLNGFWSGEIWDVRKNGERYPKNLTLYEVRDAAGQLGHRVHSFTDISERKLAEQRIHHLAHHDPLTDLPNRLSLQLGLEDAIGRSAQRGERLAVLMIDMDNFKDINDTLGHHVGDGLLIEVARRLRQNVRHHDMVARLGGDEFIVMLSGLTGTEDAARVAEKIVSALGRTYDIEGYQLHSSPSVGIGIYPEDGADVDTLLRNVDTAMYHAKSCGRNNFQFFTDSLKHGVSERLSLQNALHEALEQGQFVLHYQPQIDLAHRRVLGVEALVRWNHPLRGLVPPATFIPLAEESDLIVALGEWILKEACRQLEAWRARGISLNMSVNLSARQLRSRNLLPLVESMLEKHRLMPGELELEITESVAMDNPQVTVEVLGRLRDLGVALAIDDFGTGYSSLSHLKLLPLHRLKIDRSFVKDIETDPDDALICSATIGLARNLGLTTVAEGVETQSQLEYLKELGCDCVQGYLFSRPLPPDELEVWLRSVRIRGDKSEPNLALTLPD